MQRYADLVLEQLEYFLERCEGEPDNPFFNDRITANGTREFGLPGDEGTFLARDVLYGWVQGRAMESLAGHAQWLKQTGLIDPDIAERTAERCLQILSKLAPALTDLHEKNGRRASFMMRTDGQLLCLDGDGKPVPLDAAPGAANYSDFFFAKGFIAAGKALHDSVLYDRGASSFASSLRAVDENAFVSDLLPLNPRVSFVDVPGRQGHGSAMISLGGMILLMADDPGTAWAECAVSTVQSVMDRHIVDVVSNGLQKWDFVEYVDGDGNPWEANGQILSDPGHAIEFVGFAGKLILAIERTGKEPAGFGVLKERLQKVVPELLPHVFGYGFNQELRGIYRSVDLKTKQTINADMPWWNLPETIRAAILAGRVCETDAFEPIRQQAEDALFNHYLNPDCHRLPYPIREDNGMVSERFPAFPGIDPGYHMGLTLIDVLNEDRENEA